MDYVKMDKPTCRMVGAPCGHHGQYTFYKALRVCGQYEKILAIGDFFFVRIWQDSELVSIGELQLLWTDRISDQTLVSLRLYFLPENTPDGRNLHGEDEVLAINDKIVLKAEDLLTWICDGTGWRWGLKAVWRGACAPTNEADSTAPLHCSKLDFSDVDKEKSTMEVEADSPGVVVFSYPRYCRYRALLRRLEGIQADWLRDSLVAALGGYAAPTCNTRILYCKDTFEYPELEGHEFVCNHLAPKLKGRPRGRRKRRQSNSSDRNSDSDSEELSSTPQQASTPQATTPQAPRRPSLRNGTSEKTSGDEGSDQYKPKKTIQSLQDRTFLAQLRAFYKLRNETAKLTQNLKDLSLRALYECVSSIGGYEAVCRDKSWKFVRDICGFHTPASARRLYEKILLPYEIYKRGNGIKPSPHKYECNVTKDPHTINIPDSPLREIQTNTSNIEKRLRTPSPKQEQMYYQPTNLTQKNHEFSDQDINITSKPAELLNQEFLDSLPPKTDDTKEKFKISIKPLDKLNATNEVYNLKMGHNFAGDYYNLHADLSLKCVKGDEKQDGGRKFGDYVENKLLLPPDKDISTSNALSNLTSLTHKYVTSNGTTTDIHHSKSIHKSVGAMPTTAKSSLRSVRVKPSANRELRHSNNFTNITSTITQQPPRQDTSSMSPPVITNFGINYPQPPPFNQPQPRTNDPASDDEIIEVPYKPKTPEIIDLDDYPESPQSIKKKKLDILKERGLEVTAVPNYNVLNNPLLNQNPVLLHPAMQQQLLTQAQLFQMYNIMPSTYTNGVPPPKIIQGKSIFGTSGPEKTVYGNPKDPFMPPPHILQGTPIKPARNIQNVIPKDILDLTCKSPSLTVTPKPSVEIVKVPNNPTASPKAVNPQNLARNYTLVDGKAVVGSNLEITLVNPKSNTNANKQHQKPQKRSSNGQFLPNKPSTSPNSTKPNFQTPPKSSNLVVPNYPIQNESMNLQNLPLNPFNSPENKNLVSQMSLMDPMYVNALYSSLAGQLDHRQMAVYRELMANQFRGYSGILGNIGGTVSNTPTTKN